MEGGRPREEEGEEEGMRDKNSGKGIAAIFLFDRQLPIVEGD